MFEEDLTAFFDTDELALAATYAGSTAVNVIFDAEYVEAFGVAGANPAALGRASDFPAGAVGNTLLISGTTYTIRNREPVDDGALVRLQLEA